MNFVEANTRLPKRLRVLLEEEQSETFTIDMLDRFPSLRDFDALAADPFVVFIEPPSLDVRILNQFALFSLMPAPTACLDEWLVAHPDLCRKVVVPGLSRWLERYYLPRQRVSTLQSRLP